MRIYPALEEANTLLGCPTKILPRLGKSPKASRHVGGPLSRLALVLNHLGGGAHSFHAPSRWKAQKRWGSAAFGTGRAEPQVFTVHTVPVRVAGGAGPRLSIHHMFANVAYYLSLKCQKAPTKLKVVRPTEVRYICMYVHTYIRRGRQTQHQNSES